jgi:hypothetical protein
MATKDFIRSARILTLIFGSLVAYIFFSPLVLLIYLLIWFDITILSYTPTAEILGFETLTIAAIMSGVALGPLGGFLFGIIGLPVIILILYAVVFKTLSPYAPNFSFVAMGIAAAATATLSPLGFLTAVFLGVMLKHVISYAIYAATGSGIEFGVAIFNVAFSTLFLFFANSVGLLSFVA